MSKVLNGRAIKNMPWQDCPKDRTKLFGDIPTIL